MVVVFGILGLQIGLVIGGVLGWKACMTFGKEPVVVKEMDEYEKKIMEQRLQFEQDRVEGMQNILNYTGESQSE